LISRISPAGCGIRSRQTQKIKSWKRAALVTRPKTGEILAMIGSKDYFAEDEDGKVNVTLAKRQPGSSIKPSTMLSP